MAIMIPGIQAKGDFNASGGEMLLYTQLQKLPDSYYILHSTRWNNKKYRNDFSDRTYVEWGESDFTIFHPGLGIIVVEVKDGLIFYQRDVGWMQKNRNTGYISYIDPLAQAEKSKYYFLRLLKEKMGGSVPYSLCSAVWFTAADRNCVQGEMPLCYKEDIVLWANDLESPEVIERGIRRVFRYYDTNHVIPDEALTNRVLDVLAPEFECFQSIRTRTMALKALFHHMTQEQSYLLDYLEEQECAAIHGVAGTGKTVLAVQKAQRLAASDRVLFLCFNRFLKEHLEKAYHQDNLDFFNLESLYIALTGHSLPESSAEKDEAILDFLMDWRSYLWNYKHIVIDEGQDFKDIHLQALHEIANEQNGSFYVFYDKNQFVQGLEYPQWIDQMDCRLVLSRNCRNTKEIAITSTRTIGIAEKKIKMRRDDPGEMYEAPPKPSLYFAEGVENLRLLLRKLLSQYTQAGVSRENIAVLSCKTEGRSAISDDLLRLDAHYILSKERTERAVLFTTVRKFKGLEADVVICIDIDADTFRNERERNAFYVGTSRATSHLNLITLASQQEIASALTGDESLRGPRCIKAIRDSLCVRVGTEKDFA